MLALKWACVQKQVEMAEQTVTSLVKLKRQITVSFSKIKQDLSNTHSNHSRDYLKEKLPFLLFHIKRHCVLHWSAPAAADFPSRRVEEGR